MFCTNHIIFKEIVIFCFRNNYLCAGGIFKVIVMFDEHFNARPPSVVFQSIPFHPNGEFFK